ncbi:MAG TPA: DUF6624 domain-containing protein [Nocardioides sp.]|uniref:DUF6624 domain-containing protein n=1 Tax=Nocardioides sp. TaxID=35761 RepID=UPI002D7F8B5A|nr:DUF6624 domain-containing protein [Nocardioides sp.]HET6651973.1 DUF6624 domain-containing protein [Nocardioides sp.]
MTAPTRSRRLARLVAVGLLLAALGGCSGDESPSAQTTFDQALHDELVQMQADDQAEMTGRGADPTTTFESRQARLAEILDEHGWPGWDLVGRKGSTAAWVVVQHADLDLAFQEKALGLLEEAVAAGQASPGDLAYLTDRVAAARGDEQTFGTQIRCDGKRAVPATPIADEAGVEERRANAGLEPLGDYLAEMEELCAGDAP